jgi:hypothetical protein
MVDDARGGRTAAIASIAGGRQMRSWAYALAAAAALLVGSGGVLPFGPGPDSALASSATVRFTPSPRITAWNATMATIELQAQNVVVTTQCSTNPENPSAPMAPCGLGGFNLTVSWNPAHFSYVNIVGGGFLASTGRTASCFPPVVGPSSANLQCVTFGNPMTPGLPLGPQGTGVVGTLTLDPIAPACCPLSPVTYTEAVLVDIQGNEFPGTPAGGNFQLAPCADSALPATGTVDLQDTLAILNRFGQMVPPQDPRYNPTGPVLGDSSIDLADALYSLAEFGQACVYP